MSCSPPVSGIPPGLYFNVHEHVVDDALPPGSDPSDADLGPFQDPFPGPQTSFYSYSLNTIRQTKTLELVGPVPLTIKWKHHSVSGTPPFTDTITDDEVMLTAADPSFTWPTGTDNEYDDSFVAHRVV